MTNGTTKTFSASALQSKCLIVGVVAMAIAIVLGFANPDRFFHAYLMSYIYWSGISLGSLAIALLQHLTGGNWGVAVRRGLYSAMMQLPLLALLFLPILLLGMDNLYPWARPEYVEAHELVQKKTAYLNISSFAIRTVVAFVVWIGLARVLDGWFRRLNEQADPDPKSRLGNFGGPGLVAFSIVSTFISVDWVMSLEPEWFSTMFAVKMASGWALSSIAFAVASGAWLARRGQVGKYVRPEHYHDLGNLLLAFTMFWAYINFSQFLIIWSANLPEETTWYRHRMEGGWEYVAIALIVFHFAVPFLILLSRNVKKRMDRIARVAVYILIARLLDGWWDVMPALTPREFSFEPVDILTVVGIGGIWLGMFVAALAKRPMPAAHLADPNEPVPSGGH